jgi:hypothetical protein
MRCTRPYWFRHPVGPAACVTAKLFPKAKAAFPSFRTGLERLSPKNANRTQLLQPVPHAASKADEFQFVNTYSE